MTYVNLSFYAKTKQDCIDYTENLVLFPIFQNNCTVCLGFIICFFGGGGEVRPTSKSQASYTKRLTKHRSHHFPSPEAAAAVVQSARQQWQARHLQPAGGCQGLLGALFFLKCFVGFF